MFWFSRLILALVAGVSLLASPTQASESWLVVETGIVGTASQDILETAVNRVNKENLGGLLIRLDTPGGSLEATRAMVKIIMAAPFPVVVWVGPAGSRAGSAGAFITLAAHVAAMAPGTNIGASHPIAASGQDLEESEAARKATNDTIAFIESIAATRGRNTQVAASFVATSLAITAEEALDQNVIDYLAESESELFSRMAGKTVTLAEGKTVTLPTSQPQLLEFEPSLRQSFLEILSNPNVFYLLFIAGLIGLGFEITHPGSLFPGVVGGICLILSFIATSVLPISYGAMALVLVSIVLMVAEAFVPSFGILGIGGFVAFVIGSLLLVDPANEQGLKISWQVIAPGALLVAGFGLLVSFLVVRSSRAKVASGAEGMVGLSGKVLADFFDGRGRVMVEGENWQAELAEPSESLKVGDDVEVCRVEGLKLVVRSKK